MDQRCTAALVDGASNSSMNGIPKITLSLDNSNLTSTSNVLSDLPEDKRKVLEHRMVNNPHAKSGETVVGFGENSRDKSYIPGAPINSESSRDKSYTSGAYIIGETSRDKIYVPGAAVTPLKPCSSAAQADAASKLDASFAIGSNRALSKPQGNHAASHPIDNTNSQDNSLICRENFGGRCNSTSSQTSVIVTYQSMSAIESGNFSAEELASSDDDSQGSASSHHGTAKGHAGSSTPRPTDEEDGILSVERKRKLFTSEDGGSGRSQSHTERSSRKLTKTLLKRSKLHAEIATEVRPPDRSPPKQSRTITHFFAPTNQPAGAATAASPAHADSAAYASHGSATASSPRPAPCDTDREAFAHLHSAQLQLAQKQQELEVKERALVELERDLARREAAQAHFEDDALQRAMAAAREQGRLRDARVSEVLKALLISRAKDERAQATARLNSDILRVGRVTSVRMNMSVTDMWEDGAAMADLNRRFAELAVEKEKLDKDKKALKDKCKAAHVAASSSHGAQSSGAMPPPLPPSDEVQEQEEIHRIRAMKLKQKEQGLMEEKERLEREKYMVIREVKRLQDQGRSKYSGYPLLNKRYLLLHLLGKGGFSEVHKAFDLVELQEVSCKIHELNSQWSEEKKANYMKHATRECEIQKKLCHPRIVRLLDVFEVSSDGFCTVLEYCDGGDLEQQLKGQKVVPEREARAIVLQMYQGLRYLNEQKPVIIHYDLKPANILFHNGEVKISDFGLSKIMPMGSDCDQGMELTSQGAGTYWYLPPECFERGINPPIISSKVDVWSVAVIFFQMLYGVKPFGQGMSQEAILVNGVIEKFSQVQFPTNKEAKVSQPAKDFMRKCLVRAPARPTVLEAMNEPYLRQQGRQASSSSTADAAGGARAQ